MKPRHDVSDEMMHLVYFGMVYYKSLETKSQFVGMIKIPNLILFIQCSADTFLMDD